MRVLNTAEDSVDEQFRETIIKKLLEILSVIAKNPANPRFTHYVFESLGLLVKFSPSNEPTTAQSLIQLVVPSLLQILSEDVQEFVPYSFQLLSYLLERLPTGLALPEQYTALVRPLLLPVVWEFRGNVPGVTRLLIAIMERDVNRSLKMNWPHSWVYSKSLLHPKQMTLMALTCFKVSFWTSLQATCQDTWTKLLSCF